ncbi:MAG: ABC transporter ATP-binding protein [Kiritimatiellia bacterium]|jgi:oligopeptide/dipeptide ABC transporter ATP-binding protein
MPLLEVNDLQVRYPVGRRRWITAVDGVSLTVAAGESVGLVGESGCGKSTLGNAILRLTPISGGGVRFDGRSTADLRGRALQSFRRRVQMVFQDPYGSLNPRLTIGAALEEVLAVHRLGNRAARMVRVAELLRQTGLDPDYARRYPHELSGGQRQRVGIARALALNPVLIIADEPVSALDVSVQAQILRLMRDLQRAAGLAWLFIAHDLAVVNYMCQRVYVMYFGRIMESGPANDIFNHPAHPYTKALLAAVPTLDAAAGGKYLQSRVLHGETPAAGSAIAGCPFHPRCAHARDVCRAQIPPLTEEAPGRWCRCHLTSDVKVAI